MPEKRRVIDDALYAHFVTFSVYRRRRLLDHDHAKRIVLGVLNLVLERTGSRCLGLVIMPDHVHALIWLPVVGRLIHFLHEWKRLPSLKLRRWLRTETSHYSAEFGERQRFWQPRYYASRSTNSGSWTRSWSICT